MKISRTSIADVLVIEPRVYSDDRGWFMESFNDERFRTELTSLGLSCPGTAVSRNKCNSQLIFLSMLITKLGIPASETSLPLGV